MYTPDQLIHTPSDSQTIWRYMDLTKFLALMMTSRLYLSPVSSFPDKYEMRWPCKFAEALLKQLPSFLRAGGVDQLAGLRERMYANCWCAGSHELSHLWTEFAPQGGVAIRSSIRSLKSAIADESRRINIGTVRYVDYSGDWKPTALGWKEVAFLKRREFLAQYEVRILYAAIPEHISDLEALFSPQETSGAKVCLSTLIEEIVVSPGLEDWVKETVAELCRRCGVSAPVKKSTLFGQPDV